MRDRLVIRTIAGGSRTTHVSITISRVPSILHRSMRGCPSGLCGVAALGGIAFGFWVSSSPPQDAHVMVGPCLGYRHDSRRGLFAVPRTPWAEGRLAGAERAGNGGDRFKYCRHDSRGTDRRSDRQVDLTECGCLTRIAERPESASGWRGGRGGGRRWSRSRSTPRR